jgi:hypothetical protein
LCVVVHVLRLFVCTVSSSGHRTIISSIMTANFSVLGEVAILLIFVGFISFTLDRFALVLGRLGFI